ncbi:MAG: amidase [Woeseia sp.]|nr:amidase [Woeseia sp.]
MGELAFIDAIAQAELVKNKEVTPIELVNAAIERVEESNPKLNAVITPLFERARGAAASPIDGPFAGVPFLLKDFGAEYADSPLSGGSSFLAGHYVSSKNSELVNRYLKSGLIIIGKTNTPEFALMPTTEPREFGPSRNPWDITLTTGGSSGGSAAAVASGMVAAAHANDGGGSIRVPSACCGLVGLKPTRGRNTLGPEIGDAANGLLCDHVVTRSVRDSAAILDATSGPLTGDPYYPKQPEGSFLDHSFRKPGKLRIGFSSIAINGVQAHPDCIAAVKSVAKLCEELGHCVDEASPTVNGRRLFKAFGSVWAGFLCWSIKNAAMQSGRAIEEELFEPTTWRTFLHGERLNSGEYLIAVQELQKAGRDAAAFFNNYDIWLTPTLLQPPVPLGYFDYTAETRKEHIARLGEYTGFTLIANVSGQPGISLPLHWNANNLPIGVHLLGRYGDEVTLIRLAGQLERAQPWADRKPQVGG